MALFGGGGVFIEDIFDSGFVVGGFGGVFVDNVCVGGFGGRTFLCGFVGSVCVVGFGAGGFFGKGIWWKGVLFSVFCLWPGEDEYKK